MAKPDEAEREGADEERRQQHRVAARRPEAAAGCGARSATGARRGARRAPPRRRGRAELLAPALRAHAVEHDEVPRLDPLAVADDLLAALHRDADRLHARRRLRAPAARSPPGRARASAGPWRGASRRTAARSAARLALEPRRGGPRDLVARRGEVRARARGPADDALALRRAVAHRAHDEARARGRRRGAPRPRTTMPGEPLAREPGELPLHRLREARGGERGEVVVADHDLQPRDERVALRRVAPGAARASSRAGAARARAPASSARISSNAAWMRAVAPRRRRRRRARRRGARPAAASVAAARRRGLVDDVVVAVRLDRRRRGRAERVGAGQAVGAGRARAGPPRRRTTTATSAAADELARPSRPLARRARSPRDVGGCGSWGLGTARQPVTRSGAKATPIAGAWAEPSGGLRSFPARVRRAAYSGVAARPAADARSPRPASRPAFAASARARRSDS